MMPGDVSSQYITALMLIGAVHPRRTAPLVVHPVGVGVVPRHHRRRDGVVRRDATSTCPGRRVLVKPGRYEPTAFTVEPDASSASYPLAAAAMVGGAVCVRGLGEGSVQGDARFVDVLASMGCLVSSGDDTVVMRRRDTPLRGLDIDMSDMSDLVPTLAVVATQAVTPTRITGVGFIREKESDRLGDLAARTPQDRCRRAGRGRRAADPARPTCCTVRASRPITTIASPWRSACSASWSMASRSPTPASCRRAGRRSGTCSRRSRPDEHDGGHDARGRVRSGRNGDRPGLRRALPPQGGRHVDDRGRAGRPSRPRRRCPRTSRP